MVAVRRLNGPVGRMDHQVAGCCIGCRLSSRAYRGCLGAEVLDRIVRALGPEGPAVVAVAVDVEGRRIDSAGAMAGWDYDST